MSRDREVDILELRFCYLYKFGVEWLAFGVRKVVMFFWVVGKGILGCIFMYLYVFYDVFNWRY